MDKGSQSNAARAVIQNSQCETAWALPVLRSDRQYNGSEELSDADKMVTVQVAQSEKSEKMLYDGYFL